ncbi:MAG: hypothetical protein CFE26_24200, partial [Verrucomicrobiales bacterium VVV1]
QRDSKTAADPAAKPLSTGEYTSTALQTLWAYAAAPPYQPRSWVARVPQPSPVVIDFLPGADLTQSKSHLGYQTSGKDESIRDTHVGHGRIVLYNFGSKSATGKLEVKSEGYPEAVLNEAMTLLPGEAKEIPVKLRVSNKSLSPRITQARFSPEDQALSPSHWSTVLIPATTGMMRRVAFAFDHDKAAAAENESLLQSRPFAQEEPKLTPLGRWLVSQGVIVKESKGVWRFEVDALPKDPLRPAMVELPLPHSFRFSGGQILNFAYRLGSPQAMDKPQLPMLDVYFRTATGNLYQVWPR